MRSGKCGIRWHDEPAKAGDNNFSPTWSEAERGVGRQQKTGACETGDGRVFHTLTCLGRFTTHSLRSCVAKVMIACSAGSERNYERSSDRIGRAYGCWKGAEGHVEEHAAR